MCPEVDSASESEYQGFLLGVKAASSFGWRTTTLVVSKCQEKSGALTHLEPLGPPRPVVGDIHFTLYFNIVCPTSYRNRHFFNNVTTNEVIRRTTDTHYRHIPFHFSHNERAPVQMECFKYLGSTLTNDGRCTCEIKSKIAMAKAAFSRKKTLFTRKLDLNLRKELIKCYIWSMALYGAETWTLRAADQKYLESFEMWCWKRMEKISWTDHVRNVEVLLRVNEQRNILHEIRKWKANWIGHILRRNCLLKQVIEGKIKGEMEVARRRGRRRKKLQDRRGYFHLKEEALDRTMWRHRFGGGFGPVVRQNTEWMNELIFWHEYFPFYTEINRLSYQQKFKAFCDLMR